MQDIRNELKIKSIRYKVEKRVYERIGHVFWMKDDRQVKAMTLGWLQDLEQYEKMPGKKWKTILFWKKLLKEAGHHKNWQHDTRQKNMERSCQKEKETLGRLGQERSQESE